VAFGCAAGIGTHGAVGAANSPTIMDWAKKLDTKVLDAGSVPWCAFLWQPALPKTASRPRQSRCERRRGQRGDRADRFERMKREGRRCPRFNAQWGRSTSV
jgi:hypothetical protein